MNLSTRQVGIIEMSTAMVLSGFIGFFVVESGQSVWNVIFFRCLFGGIGLAIYCKWRGFLSPWPFADKRLGIAFLAALALVFNWVLLFNAYSYASISLATVVYNTQPFFLILIASVFLGEKFSIGKLPWFIIAFLGLLLIIELKANDLSSLQQMFGFALALGAAILYAINTLLTKQLTGVRPEITALVNTLVGAVILLPMVDFTAVPQPALQWSYLIVLGIVHTCFMYILMYSSYQKLPITIIAILAFLYPAIAILIDFLVYGQNLRMAQWGGIILILLSVTGLNLGWDLQRLLVCFKRK